MRYSSDLHFSATDRDIAVYDGQDDTWTYKPGEFHDTGSGAPKQYKVGLLTNGKGGRITMLRDGRWFASKCASHVPYEAWKMWAPLADVKAKFSS